VAKIDLIRQVKGPQTASVYVRTTAVTSSLTGEYDLEFVPITGISASVDGPAISGSLSKAHLSSKVPNLVSGSAQVKSLLPAGTLSGSQFQDVGITGSLSVNSDVNVAQYIKHKGDVNTFINFTDNMIRLNAGGKNFVSLEEDGSAPHSAVINNAGNNIDFIVKDNDNDILFKTDASADNVEFPEAKKISGSASSTASFGTYIGDGSQLTGILSAVPAGTVSSSIQIASNISGAFSAPSASISTRLTNAEAELGNTLISSSAQIRADISGSWTPSSASFSTRLTTAESELSLTLLSGSAQVKSLLPAGTISSSQQIRSLPKMEDKTIKISQVGGANVKTLVNESNQPILNDGDILQWSLSEGQFVQRQRIINPTMSFNSSTNGLAIQGGNSVDLSSLAGGGGGGGSGLALTASNEGSALSKNVRSLNFVGSDITASNSGNAVTVTLRQTPFDGNRVVSNPTIGQLYSDEFNAGTSGSIVDFLNGMFFPNTAPTLSSSKMEINEFETGSAVVGTITATDAEQSSASGTLTFGTGSYAAAVFQIHSGSGQITVRPGKHTSASLNITNPGDGVLRHSFPATVSDGIVTSTANIFIRIIPNTAPKFRTTSVGGSIITNQTGSVNENTTNGTTVSTIFVTDSESDTLTISALSQSAGNKFAMAVANVAGGKRLTITTNTSSFDFETATQHNLEVSASDQHHGNTSGSYLTTLPIRVNVVDNVLPTMGSHAFNVHEHSGSNVNNGLGANTNSQTRVGQLSANDTEGDTITFTGLTVTSGSGKGNTNQSNPANDPFQVSSTGEVQLKAGQYLNADVFKQYKYNASYRDNFNNASSSGVITINILPEPVPTLTSNAPFFMIESGVATNTVRVGTDGRSGAVADFNSNATVSMSVSSSGFFALSSAGNLSLATNVSASTFTSGSTITGAVSASTAYGTVATSSFSVKITKNNAPTPSFSNTSANLNTNGARPSNTLTTISFSDAESDTLEHPSFVFTDPSGQLDTNKVGNTYQVRAETNLSASVYQMTASIKDEHGFNTGTTKHTITIAQAGSGSMTTNGTFRIRDTATSGSKIVTAADGDPTGTQGDLGVTYSPNYNSQAVQNFTSSNAAIHIADNGNLTVKQNFGGAGKQAGDTLTSTINFQDQFGNFGTGSLTLNVVATPNLVYGYGWSGGSAAAESTAIASMGDSGADGDAITSGSVIAMLQSGSLGSTFTPSYVGGAMTLHKSASLATMSDSSGNGISDLGHFNFSSLSQRTIIIFASASNQAGKPRSMYDGVPPDSTGTAKEYYLYAKDASIPGTMQTGIYYFNIKTPINGVSRWGMIFGEGKNTNNSRYFLMPDSASAP
tara:strand:+ start:1606 stop:5616 length:4011 start_codon:yes stop_codon:yes gene_type:complete